MDCFIMSSLFSGCLVRKAPLLQELALLACICCAIFRDELLTRYACLVLSACCLFLFTCCLVIFSAAAVLRPKPSAKDKAFLQLLDSDLEFENECRVVPLQQMNCISHVLKNSYEFCKFRPIYGLLVGIGVMFLVTCFSLRILIEDENVQEDLHFASCTLIVPGIFLTAVPLLVANSEIYARDGEHAVFLYRTFQERVEVPLKAVAGKTLGVLVTSGYMNVISTLLILACTLLSACCLTFVYTMTREDVDEMQKKYEMRLMIFKNVRFIVTNLLTVATMSGISLLSKRVRFSWKKAKRTVFGIIEKNWRWNLRAIEYLLPDVEVLTLEDLQAAIESKRIQQLTDVEKLALNYVEQPLWQTRLPFVGKIGRLHLECVQPVGRKIAGAIAESPTRDNLGRHSRRISEPTEHVELDTTNKQEPAVKELLQQDQQSALGEFVQPPTEIDDGHPEHNQQYSPDEVVQSPSEIVHGHQEHNQQTSSDEVVQPPSEVVDGNKEHSQQASSDEVVQPPSEVVDGHKEHSQQASSDEVVQLPSEVVDEHQEHKQQASRDGVVQHPSEIVDGHQEHNLQASSDEIVQPPADIAEDEEREHRHAPVESVQPPDDTIDESQEHDQPPDVAGQPPFDRSRQRYKNQGIKIKRETHHSFKRK